MTTLLSAPTSIGGSDVTGSPSLVESFVVPPYGGDSNGSWSSGTLPAGAGGNSYNYFNVTLSLNQLTDPNDTYAIILQDTSTSSGVGLLNLYNEPNVFPYGAGLANVSALPAYTSPSSTLTALETQPSETPGFPNSDFGIAEIAVVPGGNVIPSPEPRTAAAILCGVFVAFLVGRQLYVNRKSQVGLAGATFA